MPFRALALGALLTLSLALPSPARAEDEGPPLEVEPYGFARLDAVMLTHRMNHPQYSMWVRPDSVTSGGRPNLTVYGRLTRFGLRFGVDGLSEEIDISGKVEADFQNGGSESRPAPRLRHGFAQISSDLWFILAGQTWDLVSPLYTSAHADALMWNAGNLGDRRPQLRLGLTPGDEDLNFRIAAAAATTGAIDGQDLDQNGRLDGFDAGVPMVQGLAEVNWKNWTDQPLTAGVSASWAVEHLSGPPADISWIDGESYGGERTFYSRSLNAHLSLPLTGWWRLRGEAFYGDNLADVRGGIGQSLNARTGEEIRAVGGWAETVFEPHDKYQAILGASIDDVFDGDLPGPPANEDCGGDCDVEFRTRNRTLYAVQKYRPWEPVQFGLEYWYWATDYADAETGNAHRVNFHTSVFF